MYKSLILSKTFWAVIINALLKIAGLFFAVSVDEETVHMASDLAVSLISFGMSFFFDAYAIYGRVKAKHHIKGILK